MSLRQRIEAWQTRTTLQRQLQTAALIISTVIGLPTGGVLLAGEYLAGREALHQDLRIQARIVAANSAAAAAFGDRQVAEEMLAAMQSSPHVAGARLVLNDGTLLAQYRSAAAADAGIWGERFRLDEPVSYRGQRYGELTLTGDYADLNRRLAIYMATTILLVVMAVTLAIFAFNRALVLAMQPLSRLAALMRRVSEHGDYALRSDLASHNELGEIAHSFNEMLEQIGNREQRLAYLAAHDPLTGLGNRSAFMQKIASAQQEGAPLCLQLLDVDHFKVVNDSLGHHAGDHLLVEVAARLQSLRSADIEVFRIGGDEFAVLLRGCSDSAGAQALAARITGAISEPFRIAGQELFTSLSIGIALCPLHAQDAEPLLNCADLALYQAKSLGRNRWSLFCTELKANVEQRMRLEADLRHALDREELFLVYEPQLALADRSFAGMEALARWQHPELGLLEPARFIPLAEETGLIHKLGEWVLRRACRDAAAMRAALGPALPRLAVNLSPRQLADPAVVDMVARALADSGLPGEALELEVTESVMIEKLDLVGERMRAIAALGVSFAMDDFGVGASSLSYLRRLPLSKIKIDRCFVRELPQNEDDAAVAAAITTLGIRLGIPVLAEGVETAAQLECLRGMGCQMAQGYLFSGPRQLDDFMAYLRQRGFAAPA